MNLGKKEVYMNKVFALYYLDNLVCLYTSKEKAEEYIETLKDKKDPSVKNLTIRELVVL